MLASKSKASKVSSTYKESFPRASKIAGPFISGNQEYVPKPLHQEEKAHIYQFQVLIPFYISGKTHGFMGPITDPKVDFEKLRDFFHVYQHTRPIASLKPKATYVDETRQSKENVEISAMVLKDTPITTTENPIDLSYMRNSIRVFRSCPLFRDHKNNHGWLKKVETKKVET